MSKTLGPVFIGGLDRSGKTPLRLMLSCHPNLSLTRRTYMWTRFYNRFGNLSWESNFERCLAAMTRLQPIRKMEPNLDLIRREFWRGKPTYARLFALFHEQYAQRMGKPRWGDQLAFVEHYAEPIFEAFPDARLIHMVRHPRQRFEASDIGLTRRTGRAGWDIARWLFSVRLGQQNLQRYPGRYRMVKYEALLQEPEQTLREICEFIGEDFYPGMLTLQGAMRSRDDRSDPEIEEMEVQAALSPSLTQMTKQEIVLLQRWARKEMLAMGYTEEPVELTSRDFVRLYTVDAPANFIGAAVWNVLKSE